jgi:hypothetical protein
MPRGSNNSSFKKLRKLLPVATSTIAPKISAPAQYKNFSPG